MRRGSRWLAAGTALAAAVVGGLVVRDLVGDDSGDHNPPADEVAVLTIDDAEPAPARLERAIARELAPDVRRAGIRWPADRQPRVIVGRQPDPTSVEVIDPRTGARTPLPTPWADHQGYASVIGLTTRAVWVSWVDRVDGEGRPAAMRYDLASGEHRVVLAPAVPHHPRTNGFSRLAMGADGRFYFRTSRYGHDGPEKHTQLWSFSADAPEAVRLEGKAQQWSVTGSLLARLDYDADSGPYVLHLSEATMAEEHRRTLDDCGSPHLESSTSWVVIDCDNDEIVVLDPSADEVARLEVPDGVNASGYGPPSLHVGEHWVTIGRLAYEPETGRLLRLRRAPYGS